MTWVKTIKKLYGSQAKFAKKLGVSPMTVAQWKKRGVPAERAIQIEELDSRIPRYLTRPDLFKRATEKKVAA